MSFHTFCLNASVSRILNNIHKFKWNLYVNGVFHKFKITQLPHEHVYRIIFTSSLSSHRNSLQCKIQDGPEKDTQQLYITDNFLKENFNINDARHYKIIMLPNENNLDELLWTNEFKDVLCRSSLLYNVNVVENCKTYFHDPYNLHSTNIQNSSINYLLSHESIKNCDQVYTSNSETKDVNRVGKPTEEQLLHVINCLTYSLLNFFEKPHDYTIYHKNIIFKNNINGVSTKGLNAYIKTMYLLKLYGYINFARVKVEILKVTHHLEDGTIRVRWRVNGITRQQLLSMLWSRKVVDLQDVKENAEWLDGFSVFSVGEDGLIYKHVCDKMIPDDELSISKKVDLKSKLLKLLGLAPRTPAGSLQTLLPYCRNQVIPFKKFT